MDKKLLRCKFNSQDGLTGADVVISIIIILTAIGVIAMMFVNFSFTSRGTDRKTRATQIATSILENMGQVYYDEIEMQLENNGATDAFGNVTTSPIYGTTIPTGYSVNIQITDNVIDVVKSVQVTVKYDIDGKTQSVLLKKVFVREDLKESNSPNLSDSVYLNQLKTDSSDTFLLYDSNSQFAGGEKIICPIRFDKDTYSYVIVDNLNANWYSYLNKLWARVLVIPSDEVADYITNGVVTDLNVLTSNYSYLWIPRFGIKNGSLNIDLFFKYLNTDYAIINNTNYYSIDYLNEITESTERNYDFTSIENFSTIELTGKWCNYSEINSNSSVAYYLNRSQYGPMFEY